MNCIEVWKAECECGEAIVFPVGQAIDKDNYRCKCGNMYLIDRYAGHYHKLEECKDAELIESKKEA